MVGALRTFDSLRVRDYRVFWMSMLFQWAAWNMQTVAKGWFLYELTKSPFLLGLMGASMGIPMFVFSFFGGALADRMDKRQLLLYGTLGQGLTMLAVAVLVTTGYIVWWHLLVASSVQGVLFALTIPARQSAVPQLVNRGQLMNAVSLNTAGMNVAGLAAPALAGFLVALIDVSGVYWVITSCFIFSGVIMVRLPSLPPSVDGRAHKLARDMAEGLRHARADVVLMLLLLLSFGSVAFGMPLNTLLPVFSEDEKLLNVGPEGLGLLLSMAGVGALVGSVAIASMGDFRRKGLVLLVLTCLWGGSVVAFTFTRNYPLALLLMVPVGMGQAGRNVLVSTLMLTRAPEEVRGRIISLNMMTWGLQPLGLLPIGAAAEAIGAPMAVAIGGGIVVVLGLSMFIFSPRLRNLE